MYYFRYYINLLLRNTTFSILLFLSFAAEAQINTIYSPAEKFILELLARDTSSSNSIYLPHEIKLGIPWTGHTYVIIAKEKKTTLFMLAGTQRVYKLNPDDPLLPLVRLDSSDFYGDNFNCMGFIHRDTLYQYGGYGFWKNRDFFTRFIPASSDWEFIQGGDGLENLLTLTYLDRPNNTFYSFGHYTQNTFKNFNPEFSDSIYQYNLISKKWEKLGRINPAHPKTIGSLNNGAFFETPWGICVRYQPQNFLIIDFKHNLVIPFKKTALENIEGVRRMNQRKIPGTVPFDNFISLKDSLYFINGNDLSVSVARVRLDSGMLDFKAAIPLYEPISLVNVNLFNLSFSSKKLISGAVIVLIISAIIAMLLKFYRKKEIRIEQVPLHDQEPFDQGKAIIAFWGSIPEVEKEFLKELVQNSLQGKKMPASNVNKLLGVSHRESEIQKARRSQTITHINENFTRNVKIPGSLISRERDNSDKRAFVYFIPEELVIIISPYLT